MLQSTFIFTTTMTAKENCQKSENWVEKLSDTHTLDKCRFEEFVSDILILFFFVEILQGIDG